MRLYIVKGETPGRELVVDKSEFTIGREVDNDFVISEVGVSRRHCRMSLVGGEWLVEDCHSVNGILVNGQKVDGGIILRPNDEITVFSHVFRFLPDSDTSASDPRRSSTKVSALKLPPEISAQTTASIVKPNTYSGIEEEKAARRIPISGTAIVKLIVLAIILIAAAYLICKLRQPDDQPPAEPETTAANQTVTTPDAGVKTALLPETVVTGLAAKPVQDNGEDIPAVETPPAPTAETDTQATAPAMFAENTSSPLPRKPASFTIVVRSEPPGAEVVVDKTSYGVAPAVVPDLAPGRHLLELQLDGYEAVSRQIQIPEDNTSKPFAMHLRAGVVLLTSNPAGAGVWHGRQFYGVTPLLLKNLPEGQYDFSLHGPGCEPHKVTATVSRAKGEVITADLKSTLGSVAVTSRPPGCRVYLDGIFKGVTSDDKGELLLTDLAAGPATMK
ncbi:MAG TPA: PEGA domain-containing protein, partial [Lentisphaeria bacterium]|nr:PEGA domain-containing protein [Lentisphaeria bacterium]